MFVIFQTRYEPHSKKRPWIIFKVHDKEELMNRILGQLSSTLDDYNIIITNSLTCKYCGLELEYELYQYNRMCNRCDQEHNE